MRLASWPQHGKDQNDHGLDCKHFPFLNVGFTYLLVMFYPRETFTYEQIRLDLGTIKGKCCLLILFKCFDD